MTRLGRLLAVLCVLLVTAQGEVRSGRLEEHLTNEKIIVLIEKYVREEVGWSPDLYELLIVSERGNELTVGVFNIDDRRKNLRGGSSFAVIVDKEQNAIVGKLLYQ